MDEEFADKMADKEAEATPCNQSELIEPLDSITVLDRIRQASDNFERTTGKRPVSVYLGYCEWADLKNSSWVKQQYVATRDWFKPMADGKRIFVVTEDSHLAVA
jgi:hypothetical protein